MKHQIQVTIDHPDPVRADLALKKALSLLGHAIPRQRVKQWFGADQVMIEGRCISAIRLLPPGVYQLECPDPAEEILTPTAQPSLQGSFLPVVYEDHSILVLHKTSGTPSVPHSQDETDTAVSSALARCPELKAIGRGGLEPAILHRLDTGTSGLLLFAKKQTTFQVLLKQWQEKKVRKLYRALVRALPDKTCLELDGLSLPHLIDSPMGHDPKSSKRMVTFHPESADSRSTLDPSIRGKLMPARTWILAARRVGAGLWDLELEIETGVMHQIRCHLASTGWPIQGDPIYRGAPSRRLWLHAWRIEIEVDPGQKLSFEAKFSEGWPETHKGS